MVTLKDKLPPPKPDDPSGPIGQAATRWARNPLAISGLLVLLLGIVGVIWFLPEVRRYLRNWRT